MQGQIKLDAHYCVCKRWPVRKQYTVLQIAQCTTMYIIMQINS
jgi:hypothetical protein